MPSNFSDGFEGRSLDPFWSTVVESGSITFPSTAQVHSGAQAVQFNSTYGTGTKDIELDHSFTKPVYGHVSIWVYDTAADELSSNYFSLSITNSSLGLSAGIGTFDYDLGSGNGGDVYYYHSWGDSGPSRTSIDRTQAWHRWEIDATEQGTNIAVDGTEVFSSSTTHNFDLIRIAMSGPSWRPAWTTYFDDFELTSPNATTTTAAASATSANFGQAVTLTATVSAVPPDSGTPTGSVDFFDSTTGTDLGSVPLSGDSASLTTTGLPLANQTITTTYSGDDNFQASSGTVTVTVVPSIYVLNTTVNATLNLVGSGSITIPGLVQVDSSAGLALEAQGNAQVQAGSIQVVGGFGTRGSATLSPAPVMGVASVPDSLAGLPIPTVSIKQGSLNLAAGSLTINAGIYQQIAVSGTGSLTFNPGIYVVAGGGLTVTGSGSLTGSGVLIYNAGSNYVGFGSKFGAIDLVGQGTISLTPASTGLYAGILIFQSRDNSQAIGLSASSALALQGSILYAPAALLSVSGNALIENALVVNRLQLGVSAGGIPQLAFQTNASPWRSQSSASGETALYETPFAPKAGSLVAVHVASQSCGLGVSAELAKLVITSAGKAHHARLVEQLFEQPSQDGVLFET